MQKSHRKAKIVFASVFAFFGITLVKFFTPYIYTVYSSDQYLAIHNTLELISIFIALSVSSMVWLFRDGLEDRAGRFLLCIGLSFFAVGAIDFFHTMSYNGMPVFITPNSYQKALVFWFFGRYTVALAFIAACFFMQKPLSLTQSAWIVLSACIAIIMTSIFVVIHYLPLMPPLYVDGYGLTPLKIQLEYNIIALYAFSLWLLWRNQAFFKESIFCNLAYFLIFSIATEVAFTFYHSVYDSYNLIAHIYKVGACGFLFNAIYRSGVINHFYTLSEMGKMSADLLAERISLDPLLDIQMDKIQKLIPDAERIVFYVKEEGDQYRSGFVWGKFSDLLPRHNKIHFNNLYTHLGSELHLFTDPINVLNQLDEKDYTPEIAHIWRDAKQLLYIPLVTNQQLHGFIMLFIFSPFRRFDAYEVEKALVFQKFATLAIAQTKQHETIYRLSYEDSLSGLPNRRFFFEKLNEAKQDALRYGVPFTVIFLDMNDLKYINDTFGHNAGDLALRLIGKRLKGVVRSTDTAARLGGDEFGIIYKFMDLKTSQQKVLDLQQSFADLELSDYAISFSLAVGGASFPEEAANEELLVKLADDRMYAHKRKIKEARLAQKIADAVS